MGSVGFPETSATNCHHVPRNISQECSSDFNMFLKAVHARTLINNSHNKINKCTAVNNNIECTQMNGAVSKVNKKFISHVIRAQRTPSAAATVQVSHALPAVRFSCLLRGRGASFKDGVAAEKGFLCAPF